MPVFSRRSASAEIPFCSTDAKSQNCMKTWFAVPISAASAPGSANDGRAETRETGTESRLLSYSSSSKSPSRSSETEIFAGAETADSYGYTNSAAESISLVGSITASRRAANAAPPRKSGILRTSKRPFSPQEATYKAYSIQQVHLRGGSTSPIFPCPTVPVIYSRSFARVSAT